MQGNGGIRIMKTIWVRKTSRGGRSRQRPHRCLPVPNKPPTAQFRRERSRYPSQSVCASKRIRWKASKPTTTEKKCLCVVAYTADRKGKSVVLRSDEVSDLSAACCTISWAASCAISTEASFRDAVARRNGPAAATGAVSENSASSLQQ